MPLHLLGKKSWNVYNSANIEKVRSDEAAAALREEERDRLTQEQDAQRRTALLRGEEAPVFAPLSPLPDSSSKRKRDAGHDDAAAAGLSREEKRALRRGRDEDETSHAIRVAKLNQERGSKAALSFAEREKDNKGKGGEGKDVQITDHAGHIQLFAPPDEKDIRRGKSEKNKEFEVEKKRKERELEDQYTMRFSNAAGYNSNVAGKPWYAAATTTAPVADKEAGNGNDQMSLIEEKNVWGRPDPGRKTREEKRISSSDPFAFMQKAQGMLKQSERDKRKWRVEKEREMTRLGRVEKFEREARRKEREARRRETEERRRRRDEDDRRDSGRGRSSRTHRHDEARRQSVDSLEGFSLDAPAKAENREHGRHRDRHHHSKDKHGHRDRGEDDSQRRSDRTHGRRAEWSRHDSRSHDGDARPRRKSTSREQERSQRSSKHENNHRRRSRSPRRERRQSDQQYTKEQALLPGDQETL